MIITVTLNTSIDRTLFIDDFGWNRTIRTSQTALGMGGKAADASWVLAELGYANMAMGFAAGTTGRQMEEMLKARGCLTDFTWVKGETRTNIVVIGREGQGQSTLVGDGLIVSQQDIKRFREKYQAALRRADCVLIGGSLPKRVNASIYSDLVSQARVAGLPVVFDASGPGLKAGLKSRPTVVKPNMDEIAELAGKPVNTLRAAYREGRRLVQQYGSAMIITLGKRGALAVLPDRAWRMPALKIPVVSTAGAGDAVLAGLAAALARRRSIEDGLKLGFAAAAAVCLTPATADCRRADVKRLLPQVKLIAYKG